MAVRQYQELLAWQRAMDLAEQVYRATREFPREELYGLTSQIRRAVISVPANIAEGQGRRTTGEFLQFLGNSTGSVQEVETELLLAGRIGYLDTPLLDPLMNTSAEVSRIIAGLRNALEKKRHQQ